MLKYEVEGYFSTEQCKKIKEKLEGKTFFNFIVQYGSIAGNNSLIIMSDIKNYTDEELKNMVIYYVFNSL